MNNLSCNDYAIHKPDKREELILEYIKDKKVLDLGVGDTRDRFLHKFVHMHSAKCIGLELDKNRAKILKSQGYDIVYGDAQEFNLSEKFDIIIAGDLIEHLDNFRGFFNSIEKHITKEGLIIMNTPNVFSIYHLIGLNKRLPFCEHTCWFCSKALEQLVHRLGFKIKKKIYYTHDLGTLKGKVMQLVFRFKPHWNENILMVLKMGD